MLSLHALSMHDARLDPWGPRGLASYTPMYSSGSLRRHKVSGGKRLCLVHWLSPCPNAQRNAWTNTRHTLSRDKESFHYLRKLVQISNDAICRLECLLILTVYTHSDSSHLLPKCMGGQISRKRWGKEDRQCLQLKCGSFSEKNPGLVCLFMWCDFGVLWKCQATPLSSHMHV